MESILVFLSFLWYALIFNFIIAMLLLFNVCVEFAVGCQVMFGWVGLDLHFIVAAIVYLIIGEISLSFVDRTLENHDRPILYQLLGFLGIVVFIGMPFVIAHCFA